MLLVLLHKFDVLKFETLHFLDLLEIELPLEIVKDDPADLQIVQKLEHPWMLAQTFIVEGKTNHVQITDLLNLRKFHSRVFFHVEFLIFHYKTEIDQSVDLAVNSHFEHIRGLS